MQEEEDVASSGCDRPSGPKAQFRISNVSAVRCVLRSEPSRVGPSGKRPALSVQRHKISNSNLYIIRLRSRRGCRAFKRPDAIPWLRITAAGPIPDSQLFAIIGWPFFNQQATAHLIAGDVKAPSSRGGLASLTARPIPGLASDELQAEGTIVPTVGRQKSTEESGHGRRPAPPFVQPQSLCRRGVPIARTPHVSSLGGIRIANRRPDCVSML